MPLCQFQGCATLKSVVLNVEKRGYGTTHSMALTEQLHRDLGTLQGMQIFFAHQSVGGNILDGLAFLAKEARIALHIDPHDPYTDTAGIKHGKAGRNGHPDSKIQYFVEAIAALEHRLPRVALMKFCYVDFTPSTDSDALLQRYQDAIGLLQRKYPAVTFVHVTVPLTTTPRGVKDTVKRLFGRAVRKDEANARRTLFNERLRVAFRDQPLFDLARVESTRPDGTLESVKGRNGIDAVALYPGYTSDGGHLNERGRELAAAEFARVVAAAVG